MVIPSDITRWGFVKSDLGNFQELFFEGAYIDYEKGDWRLIHFYETFSGVTRIEIRNNAQLKIRGEVSGPGEVYNFLKKVGYFVENTNVWQQ